MRVLVTVTGSPSHVNAVRPLASALATAGHQVLVAAPARLLAPLAGLPLRLEPLLVDPLVTVDRDAGPSEELVLEIFAGPHVTDSYHALLPVAREFGPQLVIRDGGEFAGYLVAETLGVPHLSAPSGAANHLDPVALLPHLNQRRADLDLPPEPDPAAVHRHGRLDCMPAGLSFAGHPGGIFHRYRQPTEVDPNTVLPEWIAELPADQPLVLASLGTVLPFVPTVGLDPVGLLGAIATGLAELDCQAVIATGGLPVDLPSLPTDRVHLVDSMPQPLLLRCAQLLLTHGGYNSIREAVGAGVPMAVLPCFGDQPANADRVEQLGLGLRIPAPADVAATCHRVLTDPAHTANSRRAQRRMLALPPIQGAIADLEKLVRG
ncbi:glycosyltransferase [Kitasatospora viridis]|uniref:N-glycosyltransferase n=1 Tax=Kitasatospora viridis TaxID=281105 RepID=A0A561UQ99_9ACTN|nr:glycosyltransferase [Kitasatospora viridis]TWG01536.1 N-glycosyltransferase [Kitasatospora viridis]